MSTPARVELALERTTFERAFDFERFALAFLASEIPALRPVGGMHDGARDAFVHTSGKHIDVFVQCSVARDWKAKIRNTIKALLNNGQSVRELIFCTSLVVQADSDDVRAELRAQGIALDVRDRSYFSSRSEAGPGQQAASEELARLVVDPLLTSRGVIAAASSLLTPEEEKIAATYLQLELQDRNTQRGLTKLCFESIVAYSLRDSSPEALSSRMFIRQQVSDHIKGADKTHLHQLTDSALNRLVKKGHVKHHTREDAFLLSFQYREEFKSRVETLLRSEDALKAVAVRHVRSVVAELAVDYPVAEHEVAADAVQLLEHIFCEQGRLAAVALVGGVGFSAPRQSVDAIASSLLKSRSDAFASLRTLNQDQFLDLIPLVVERIAATADAATEKRLRTLADAYCLQFMLQQTPDVQKAISAMLSGITLLVDTSIVIRAMAEHHLPPNERRLINLLRVAKDLGCDLLVGEDVLNEVETHLDRVSYNYRRRSLPPGTQSDAQRFEMPLIEGAYHDAHKRQLFIGSFDTFLDVFKGCEQPRQDLIEYLKSELGIRYADLGPDLDVLAQNELGTLFAEWKQHKYKRPWVDEQAFETLVLHDVRAFMLVESKRSSSITNASYGHRWWWLAMDGSALRFDRERHGNAPGSRVCMNPDFFARYLSLCSKPPGAVSADARIPASAIHLASMGLVPAELRDEARNVYSTAGEQPEYLRRRKIRELINKTIAVAGEKEPVED